MTRRLRTTSKGARKKTSGAKPITRHQPLETSLVAGSFMVEFARSAALRRA